VKNIIDGKKEGKVPRGRPRDKYMGQIKKRVRCKKYQEVSQVALDSIGWGAANLRIERPMMRDELSSRIN
jgi:hypothetical protein